MSLSVSTNDNPPGAQNSLLLSPVPVDEPRGGKKAEVSELYQGDQGAVQGADSNPAIAVGRVDFRGPLC